MKLRLKGSPDQIQVFPTAKRLRNEAQGCRAARLPWGLFFAVAPRIHFAGEHLSAASSWMQGALQSGLRAVKEINDAA
jgi:monoamine oxidase